MSAQQPANLLRAEEASLPAAMSFLALLTAPAAKAKAVKGSIIVNLYPPAACVVWGYCPDTVVPTTVQRGITGVVALLVEPAASAIDERMGVPNEHQCTEHG